MPENVFFTIPDRDPSSTPGSVFVQTIMNIGPTQEREDLIFAEFQKGNIPDFMRNPSEVVVSDGTNTLHYNVLPDVLCVGTDDDFVRTPLAPATAQKIADLFGCCLPTQKMADQIWKGAAIRLAPNPNGPPYDITMQLTQTFVDHNAKIEAQRAGNPFGLITGHKKDVVICKHLLADPSKVSIYGWFNLNGSPIQGLNPTSHAKDYKDYSHGLRMISRVATLNNQVADLYAVLNDPSHAALISYEGAFDASTIYKG
jgi:hypothetical protein